jgi:hypothetical protein
MLVKKVIENNRINKIMLTVPEAKYFINNYHFVEIIPVKKLPIYQFKLHLHSNLNGAYVLIKDNSAILDHLKSGETIETVYYPKKKDVPAEQFKTQILNISKKEHGSLKGHFKVELSIMTW